MFLTGLSLVRALPRSSLLPHRLAGRIGMPRMLHNGASEIHQIKRQNPMSWADFFALRKRRRRVRMIGSLVSAFAFTGLAYSYFANLEVEVGQMVMGFEMIYVYGLGIVVAGCAGFLVGPSLGDVAFRALLGKRAMAFADADNLFLRHIARNRPNPAKVSATNPLNDYYGEKVGSIDDYRKWLRESRLFKRRSEKYL